MEVATDGTVVEDRWPPMDFPGLSTRVDYNKNFPTQYQHDVRFSFISNNENKHCLL